MKNLEVIYDKNTCHRLTITPTRISIKLMKGTTEHRRKRVIDFFLMIASRLENQKDSLRGSMNDSQIGICMVGNNRNISYFFSMNEKYTIL